MYEMNDTVAAIYAIQQLLRDAGYEVIPDGVYGEETVNAVSRLQSANDLPPTGRVDLLTFEALAAASSKPSVYRCVSVMPATLEGGVISTGEESAVVVIIQAMLRVLSVIYDYGDVPLTGVYDGNSESAIRDIQRVNGLVPTGTVDPDTWNALVAEYEKYKNYDM